MNSSSVRIIPHICHGFCASRFLLKSKRSFGAPLCITVLLIHTGCSVPHCTSRFSGKGRGEREKGRGEREKVGENGKRWEEGPA